MIAAASASRDRGGAAGTGEAVMIRLHYTSVNKGQSRN
jgi:hypothetical protein